ncbi:hypothetical protein DVH05_000702 [Phytophthora capsici]|nr:hypothetical protein DVH05_000702 [Phytophthora capsici]
MMELGQGLRRATDLAEGTLLKTPSAFLGVNLRKGLYVRQEYWDVYSILNKELEDGETTRVLVLGSPGIGKSVFGVFLLLLFMSERKDVAYRPLQKRKELYYFTWDIEHNSYEVSLEPVSHRYYEGLFDGNDKGGAWYSSELVHSYLFASPGTNSYHAFAKEECTKIYMNPWTMEECKKYVDKVINPWRSIQPGSDTQNEWFMRYNIIGGKSRWLFSGTLKLKDFVEMVENAIPETFEDLKTVFRSIWAYRGYDGVENVLFALFRDENNPSRYVIDFASGIIDCKVSARFNSVSMGEFKRKCMTSNPLAQAGRGHIRERLLLENAATSKMLVRPLEEEGIVSAKLAGKLGPYKATSKMFQRVSEIVAEECLYRPVSKTFPSIDGVLVVPREKLVIYLQTTVSLRHSIQHKALKSAIDILVKKQGFADYTHIFLSLVDSTVETDTYDQFKKQRFKNVNNEDRQKVNNFEVVVRQYVGKIDNDETGSAVSSPSPHNRLKRTRSEINGKESDGSSSGGNTKQRGGTKNPKAPVKRRSLTRTSSRSKKGKTSN